jgi:hypothetical protein
MTAKMTARQLVEWQGYLTMKEMETLQNLAAELPLDAIVVKIGAGAGTDTLAILETTVDVLIFSVDIVCGECPTTTNEHLRLEEAGFSKTGNVIRIWGDSKVVGLRWPFPLDWLLVDGDHSAEGLTGDIKAWFRHVKPGGFISFHDYGSPNWPDVPVVVDRMMKGQELLPQFTVDTLRTYRKAL